MNPKARAPSDCYTSQQTLFRFMLASQGDPFATAAAEDSAPTHSDFIHLRIQARTGRKSITTVQGLNPQVLLYPLCLRHQTLFFGSQIDFNKLLKAFRKLFNCNGTVITDPELGQVIQLQGDHRTDIAQFLVQEQLATRDKIKLHGG
ncbi:putative Translation initiation factor SUI1 family protein [Paratrimastix pyriformis]|uniref:Translation initiation factor SUI1 family protein n=1 Tax=Paratrimastix pyriformis TaxID=342808 RepID=A0ABQ8U6V9_9EUKA|nr:putative Translation initiation factor SUI1 family protein [Paratrimastix pyriformis]